MLTGTPGAGEAVTPPPQTPPASGTPPATAPAAPWKDGEVWKINDKEWWEYIPEEAVRETFKAKQYANPAVAGMAYHNLLKLQNGNDQVIAFPPDNATPEQHAAFDKTLRTRLGVPEKPDDYKIGGEKVDPRFVEFGKQFFHEIGVPAGKVEAAVGKWNTFVENLSAQQLAAENAQNDKDVTAIQTKYGVEYEPAMAAGKRAMEALKLPPELVERIEAKVGTAPIIELLVTLGKVVSENGGLGGLAGAGGGGSQETPETMTKEAAQARITALSGDDAFQKKYTDKNHPEHKDAVSFMERLHKRVSAPA
jgi:hypothetical protein